jgi:trimeric autotransporter adhesin
VTGRISRRLACVILVLLAGAAAALAYFTGTPGSQGAGGTVGALSAPSAVSAASSSTPGAVSVSWTAPSAPSGSVSYVIQRSSDGGTTWAGAGGNCPTSSGSFTATSCTDTGLAAGPYKYRATAYWHSWTATSGSASVTLAYGPATNVTVVSGSGQSATVNTAFSSQLVAVVKDAQGNPVPGVTVTFTAPSSSASGRFANSSTSTTATSAGNGQATSTTFTANTTAGSGYPVSASAIGTTSAGFTETNSPGAATKLAFTTQPSSGANVQATGTGTFAPAVAVEDTYGNVESGDSSTTVTLAIGTNPSSGTLSCTNTGGLTVTVAAGTASFSGCAITKTGIGYTLTATSSPSHTAPANANSFNIAAGSASKLVFTQQPSSSTGGIALATQPTVTVQDQNGNTAVSDASSVTLAITNGTGTSGATLSCTTNPLAASSGVAGFSGCAIDKSGTGYTLTATDGSLTSATSSSLTISVGAAAKLAFTQQPGGAVAATAFGTQPKVAVEDAGGNIVTTNSSSVTLAIGTGSGTLTCTTNPVTASSGVATFAGCKISAGGAGYTLKATDGTLTLTTSASFSVYAYSVAASGSATTGTTVTTTSFTLSANTTYLVFASSDSAATSDSASVTSSGFTTSPTITAIGSASYDSAALEWGGYVTNGSGSGTLKVTFGNTIKQAYLQVIAVTGASTSSPVAQSAFPTMTGTTTSNPASANLASAPSSSNGELIYWNSTGNATAASTWSSSSSITLVSSSTTAAAKGSVGVFGGAPPQQSESLNMGGNKTWATIAVELNHG